VEDLHRELARIAFAAGEDLGLMLAGGYAIRAHGLTERQSGDLDLATSAGLDLPTIVGRLSDALRRSGFEVQIIESKPRMARLQVTRGAAVCEVDLLKEAVGPPALLDLGPVLTLDDAVGLKVPLTDSPKIRSMNSAGGHSAGQTTSSSGWRLSRTPSASRRRPRTGTPTSANSPQPRPATAATRAG
jgi:hypothetical protein